MDAIEFLQLECKKAKEESEHAKTTVIQLKSELENLSGEHQKVIDSLNQQSSKEIQHWKSEYEKCVEQLKVTEQFRETQVCQLILFHDDCVTDSSCLR